MTRHIPEGNSLRHLESVVTDLRYGVDVWPADADERRIDDFLRRTRARPVQREWPAWLWFVFGAAAMLGGLGVALIVADSIATGAATAVQAAEYAGW